MAVDLTQTTPPALPGIVALGATPPAAPLIDAATAQAVAAAAKEAVAALAPDLQATAKEALATELARLKGNARLQDLVIVAIVALVLVLVLATFTCAALGNHWAQAQWDKALGGAAIVAALLARVWSTGH